MAAAYVNDSDTLMHADIFPEMLAIARSTSAIDNHEILVHNTTYIE
jgi:hypothetical protein